jgi:plastocyanin
MRSNCKASWPSKAIGWGLAVVLVLPGVAAPETHVIAIDGMQFQPATVTVKRGDKVVWQNKDIVPHTATATATATAAGKFDSRDIAVNRSWSWTAKAPGRYEYVCTYHPTMKGALVVQ